MNPTRFRCCDNLEDTCETLEKLGSKELRRMGAYSSASYDRVGDPYRCSV